MSVTRYILRILWARQFLMETPGLPPELTFNYVMKKVCDLDVGAWQCTLYHAPFTHLLLKN